MKTAVCSPAALALLSLASVALARRDGPWIDQPLEG